MPFIFSTLTANHLYTNWVAPNEKTLVRNIVGNPVLIKGGANLPDTENPKSAPKAIVTEVTEQQLEYLEQNSVFRKHQKAGLILVMQSKADPETVAKADMTPKDNSAPLTPDSDIFKKVDADGNVIKPMEEGKGSTIERIKGAMGIR